MERKRQHGDAGRGEHSGYFVVDAGTGGSLPISLACGMGNG